MKLKKTCKNKIFNIFKNEKGFSIIEMLLVIIIIAIVATVITMLYISSIRSQKDLLNKAGSESNLRTSMYSVAKDLREADPTGTTVVNSVTVVTGVIIARNNYIKFTSGLGVETIEYVSTLSNGTYVLNKKVTVGGSTTTKFIMGYITNDNIFSYYSTVSGAALTAPFIDFKIINLSFIVNKEPSIPVKAVSLSTMVSLRNR